MGDPRPGFERVDRPSWIDWWWVAAGLAAGLVGGLLITLLPDGQRDHALGRTEEVSALVTEARLEEGCDSGQRAVYALTWQDAEGDADAGVFRRCGPLRHQAGDRIDLWVSQDGAWTTDEEPALLWLWLVGGMTLLGGALAILNQWRIRVWARATVRGEERRRRRAGA